MTERPSTPPTTRPAPTSALTPEQVRRIEENRLHAKAQRSHREAEESRTGTGPSNARTPSGFIVPNTAGQKRPASALSTSSNNHAPTVRDARQSTTARGFEAGKSKAGEIQTARKFQKYIDYDFSTMTDTHGGFLSTDDDPHNKSMRASETEAKPAHMTVKEWERHQLLRKLRAAKAGPFEPGLSVLDAEDAKDAGCAECGSLEIDFVWKEVFGCKVCGRCKERVPEKYTLLTKTEAKEDYLLTDPELKDPELLPRLQKPNPHKREWNDMHLFLRFQVEAYAFSERKWGSSDKLDEEFEKRQGEKKRRKEEKFRSKLEALKKRTRVEAYRRGRERDRLGGGADAQFGDRVGLDGDVHEHEWGRVVTDQEGVGRKSCVECGMQVEELEF